VLACRAIDGIEEEVWFRGEVVGTRRRYDSRLLLAHIARLDALARDEQVCADAARFDELVALAGGAVPPEELAVDEDGVPGDLEDCVFAAGEAAEDLADELGPDTGDDPSRIARRFEARAQAAALWHGWVAGARAHVDGRIEGESLACTVSGVSTSAMARALAGAEAASGPMAVDRSGSTA